MMAGWDVVVDSRFVVFDKQFLVTGQVSMLAVSLRASLQVIIGVLFIAHLTVPLFWRAPFSNCSSICTPSH